MLRPLRYVLTVADLKNFTRAAEALHVSQPALSQQIRQLEGELGGQLFDRSGRTVSLTDFGRAYIDHAKQALAHLDAGRRALHDVRDLTRGLLRLAYTPTFAEYLIDPALRRFRAAHPAVAIELVAKSQEEIESALARDELDLGIGFTDVRSEEIHALPLFLERIALVVSKGHPLASWREPIPAADLGAIPLTLLSPDFVVRQFADAWFRAHQIRPPVMVQANTLGTVLKLVKQGELASILPVAVMREHEGLVSLAVSPPLPERTVALLARRNAYTTLAASAFSAVLFGLISDEGFAQP
ncbi:transcriptional regulator CynR [Paraburkholderia adhaesiva]|uniref:transcriptional regulator CynR n=1 Tax=Paraburkholderia adhaesiva TaxID=2883244 RepID=UPI001F446A9E|nr:transcriptional regulator CynR [Paraburkholderia adhaesiva]